jgi:type IV pilus assembly protein PilY1
MKRLACFAVLLIATTVAWADAVITLPTGEVTIGVETLGALGPSVGIALNTMTAPNDSIAPGCFCEGWGVSADAAHGQIGNANGGNSNITGVSFASTASTATSIVTLNGSSLQVTQAYGPSSGAPHALFQDTVTLTNTDLVNAIGDVKYTRAMDWDIEHTPFEEFVTIGGVGASALVFSNDDGFCAPDPTVPCSAILGGTTNTNFTKLGPTDQGSFFTFDFGGLAAGASKTFDIFYGAAPSEGEAIAALTGVSAEVFALGFASNGPNGGPNVGAPGSTDSGVWAFGFAGVGGTPIGGTPEPSSFVLLGGGLLLLGLRRLRKA